MTAFYAIVFDPDGYRTLVGNRIYRSEHDAKMGLEAMYRDNPAEMYLDNYAIVQLEAE